MEIKLKKVVVRLTNNRTSDGDKCDLCCFNRGSCPGIEDCDMEYDYFEIINYEVVQEQRLTADELKYQLNGLNSNFHFDNLDWPMQVALEKLCNIINTKLNKIKEN